jgi:hypothetical protein
VETFGAEADGSKVSGMTVDASRRGGASTLLTWGGMAAACLVGVLAVWLGSATTAEHALFGSAASTAVAAIGLLGTVIGVVVGLRGRPASAGVRWGLALPLAVCAGGVAALALGAFFAPADAIDVGLGFLLALATIGMNVTAARVSRGGSA